MRQWWTYSNFNRTPSEIDDRPHSRLFRQKADERDSELALTLQGQRLHLKTFRDRQRPTKARLLQDKG